jgi:formamidopyrimidine-DNA glycosylase
MPELPEVESTRRSIVPYLAGKKIIKIVIRNYQLRWPVPTELLKELPGHQILRVDRRAKYLLLGTDAGTMVLHLGMSGRLRVVSANMQVLKHDHIDLVLDSGQCLRFNDSRRFGALIWTREPPDQHPLLRALGPEPFDLQFSGIYLYNRAKRRTIAVKTFIMDSHLVAGIGNIYANESLFRAGIHPMRPANRVMQSEYEILVNMIRKVLKEAIDLGGTTLRDFVNGDGKIGHFQQYLCVYGRSALSCTTCGTAIKECRISQRVTYFCGHCQI